MKIFRYINESSCPSLGIEIEGAVCDLALLLEKAEEPVSEAIVQADLIALAPQWHIWLNVIRRAIGTVQKTGALKQLPRPSIDSLDILPPIPRPGKFICVGLNYKDHCEEQNLEPPSTPVIFAKFANAVCGHKAVVRRPRVTSKLDFEGELGVVIGKQAKRVNADQALKHVFGYMIVNDISARDIQKNDGQWLRAKSMDGFAPTGPCVVTSDEIPDPQQLALRTTVNGAVMQESHTSRMIFPVAELIEFISQGITLEPGDIISTGTPSGVGVWRKPPVFLQPGDVVRIEIENIGVLETTIAEDE